MADPTLRSKYGQRDYVQPKDIPTVSPTMAKSVSQYRRQTLEDEVNAGKFRDGSTNDQRYQTADDRKHSLSDLSNAVYSVGKPLSLTKNADGGGFGGGGGYGNYGGNAWKGSIGDVGRQAPEIYSPLWLNSNLNLPRDRQRSMRGSVHFLRSFPMSKMRSISTVHTRSLNSISNAPTKKLSSSSTQ